MITNNLEADTHSHCMLQMFLGIEENIEIIVNEKLVKCNCIAVDKNISHSFSARKKVYYSAIIEPTSIYAEQLTSKMSDFGYWIYDNDGLEKLRQQGTFLIYNSSKEQYLRFMEMLNNYLNIPITLKNYDDRITELLNLLRTCNCDNHTISSFADKVSLSASRLSHLFKEQIGIPLKSYILFHQMECAFRELLSGKNVTEASMIAGFELHHTLHGQLSE